MISAPKKLSEPPSDSFFFIQFCRAWSLLSALVSLSACAGGPDLGPDSCDTNRDARLHLQMNNPNGGRCDAEYGGALGVEGNQMRFAASAARCMNKNDGSSEGIPPNRLLFSLSGQSLTLVSEAGGRCQNGHLEKHLVRE